ncbi:MAG: M28 family metallopeptidase [Bacteroidales bacterium]
MRYFFLTLMLLLGFFSTQSQDLQYAHSIIDTMCSPTFFGRGYTHQGDTKAARFIANAFDKLKLNKFTYNYFQEYHLSTNTFSKEMKVSIGNKDLTAGIDFMPTLSSPSIEGEFKVFKIDSSNVRTIADIHKILKKNLTKKIVLIDKQNIRDKEVIAFWATLKFENPFLSKAIAYIVDGKLSWGASDGKKQNNFARINLLRKSLPKKLKKIKINICADYLLDYSTQNVVGYVKGKLYPDSFYVFTAHYDHLGEMGKEVYFPGANDNASGTAMVMDLARYFSSDTTQPDYSIVFALVSGEETGLHGSHYLASHPLFPLTNIKFLINLDMMGTGSEGITVVNATTFKDQYNRLKTINNEKGYLKAVVERGESCNSDHCAFYEKGVAAIFIYAMGGEFTEYHNVYDLPQKIPLTKYDEIFRLLIDYIKF